MRLCEEYLFRNGINPVHAVHVTRGFFYFNGGERLLSIEWRDVGPHPGFYEVSECVLEKRCRVLSSKRIEWDEYESYLVSWISSAKDAISNKNDVFDLTWRYFMRRYEDKLVSILPLSVLHATVDSANPTRAVQCMGVLEDLAVRVPEATDFWHSRAFDIVSLYCHWLPRLRTSLLF